MKKGYCMRSGGRLGVYLMVGFMAGMIALMAAAGAFTDGLKEGPQSALAIFFMVALFGGADGLDFYRALAQRMQDSLAPHGLIAVEVGQGQAQAVAALFAPMAQEIFVEKDFAGIDRVVAAVKKG